MLTEHNAHYFLGANTPGGFFSLYDAWMETPRADTLYILKGGPGCGKSTFMKTLAQNVPGGTEYIHCTGDPDSLDAVLLRSHRAAYVDGTAPHVVEPRYPAARERYLNFGAFYDPKKLAPHAAEVKDLTERYRGLYRRAYRYIAAAGEVRRDLLETVRTPAFLQKAEKRAAGIVRREVPRRAGGEGRTERRFLSALTCRGEMTLWQTVTRHYGRVFALQDSFGLAHDLLAPIARALAAAGCDTVLCPCHWDPEKIRHLLVPSLDLAFVTSTPADPYPGEAARRVRVDAMSAAASGRALREVKKTLRGLTEQSVRALRDAKALHDALEAAYRPSVDFAALDAVAAEHTALYAS